MPNYAHDDDQDLSCHDDDFSHVTETSLEGTTQCDTTWEPTSNGDQSSDEAANEIEEVIDSGQNVYDESNQNVHVTIAQEKMLLKNQTTPLLKNQMESSLKNQLMLLLKNPIKITLLLKNPMKTMLNKSLFSVAPID